MKYTIGILIAACLVCAVVQAIDFPLEYERYPENENVYRFRPSGFAHFRFTDTRPEGEWKFPELISEIPLYTWVKIGDQERLLLLDEKNKKSGFYDRIYFDANANNDLTDDRVIDATSSRFDFQSFDVDFPTIDMPCLVDGVTQPYRFSLDIYYYMLGRKTWGQWFKSFFTGGYVPQKPIILGNLNLRLRTKCMYTATLELNGDEYCMYLNDANGNGRFDDLGAIAERQENYSRLWTEGDRFYLIPANEELDHYSGTTLAKYLNLKDALYELDISLTDRRITLTPVTDQVATIELPAPVHRISMVGADNSVAAYMPGSTILVPPGTYQLLGYTLFRDEPEGAQWQMIASGTWDSPEITATADAITAYAIGEPLRPTVVVPWWAKGRDDIQDIRLDLQIEGSAKETVTSLSCIGDAHKSKVQMTQYKMPKEPTFKILKQDGEVAFQGAFEYG